GVAEIGEGSRTHSVNIGIGILPEKTLAFLNVHYVTVQTKLELFNGFESETRVKIHTNGAFIFSRIFTGSVKILVILNLGFDGFSTFKARIPKRLTAHNKIYFNFFIFTFQDA